MATDYDRHVMAQIAHAAQSRREFDPRESGRVFTGTAGGQIVGGQLAGERTQPKSTSEVVEELMLMQEVIDQIDKLFGSFDATLSHHEQMLGSYLIEPPPADAEHGQPQPDLPDRSSIAMAQRMRNGTLRLIQIRQALADRIFGLSNLTARFRG